jgi:VanZ family protein
LFLRYNLPALLWLALVTYLSNKEPSGLPVVPFLQFEGADKLVHFVFYFVLTVLLCYGWRKQGASLFLSRYALPAAALFSIAWGGLMELLQLTVFTYRAAEWADMAANTLGALLGWLLFRIFVLRFLHSYENKS